MDRRTLVAMTTSASGAGAALMARQLFAADAPAAASIAQPPRSSFIHRRDGTALFYKDWGTGRPIVFVCSAGMSCDMWAYQMLPFTAQGFRCVTFDRRGNGRSSDPGRGYDFDTLADDLAAVLETLDLRNATLVGHSMGCAEITRYLTRHGTSRVARVAMLAPTTPFLLKTSDNPEGVDRSVFQALRTQWLRDYPKWIADNTDPFFVPETSPAMKSWGASLLLGTSLQAQLECNVAVTETDFRPELARITPPVLVLHGTKDVSAPLPLTGQRTAKLLPHCEIKVYEGAPHGLFLTHMQQVNEDLLRYVRT